MILFALALMAAEPAAATAGGPIQQMTVRCARERLIGTNRTQRVCRSVRGIQLREQQDQERLMLNSQGGGMERTGNPASEGNG